MNMNRGEEASEIWKYRALIYPAPCLFKICVSHQIWPMVSRHGINEDVPRFGLITKLPLTYLIRITLNKYSNKLTNL